jgi:hypothetical protein
MRQDQHRLDVPVLLEVRHTLHQPSKDGPTEFVGAAEQGRAELGSNFPEPAYGGELGLLTGFRVIWATSSRTRFSSSESPVDGPDENRLDPVAEDAVGMVLKALATLADELN